jgi:Zn-dependent peptidase ImmA (M78 family)
VSEIVDPILVVTDSFLGRFGLDAGRRLPDVARAIGLDVVYRQVESYEGALLRIKGVPRGCVVINSGIREESRQRFTLAHEIGHFVLPDQQDLSAPCARESIENWEEELKRPELDANRFAAEILMPRPLLEAYLRSEPSFESLRSIASLCGTSLTASGFQLMALTSFRASLVWSKKGRVRWCKSSEDFVRWVKKGELSEGTFASDCFKGKRVPDRLEPVPASAWLFEKGLKEDAKIWEHSLPLPSYSAVLTVLVMREIVEAWNDAPDSLDGLDPREFTLERRRWPTKR